MDNTNKGDGIGWCNSDVGDGVIVKVKVVMASIGNNGMVVVLWQW